MCSGYLQPTHVLAGHIALPNTLLIQMLSFGQNGPLWRSLTLMLEITYTLCGDHLHTERWFPPSVPCCSSPQLLWWIGESEDGPSEHFMKLNWCKIANMVQTSWNEHGAKIYLGFTWPPSMGFHSSWVTSGATLVRSTCTLRHIFGWVF